MFISLDFNGLWCNLCFVYLEEEEALSLKLHLLVTLREKHLKEIEACKSLNKMFRASTNGEGVRTELATLHNDMTQVCCRNTRTVANIMSNNSILFYFILFFCLCVCLFVCVCVFDVFFVCCLCLV